ncbi:MAG: NAD-dependent epimerase/dehydratase family protein [Planctomycetota bacterium]|nr:NAD-dependent epimerase/dehydratase family protein [Planctomycetota bacterium]
MSTPHSVLIVGCGYRGRRLAQRLLARGHAVRGLTRKEERLPVLRALGIEPRLGDVTKPETLREIGAGITAVYHLMGSMQGSPEQLQALHVDGTRNVLAALEGAKLARYVYESSTAVYGQTGGEWLDEDAPRDPASAMGRLRVAAEELLFAAHRERGLPVVIFRPASIYRPQGVINEKIAAGTYRLTWDPEKVMNHIYIEDFLEAFALALERGRAGEAYNLSDDEPKRGGEYVNRIAELMSAPPPPVDYKAPADACADLLRQSNKRVGNAKLKRDFGLALRFPTYREGLAESARLGWKEESI